MAESWPQYLGSLFPTSGPCALCRSEGPVVESHIIARKAVYALLVAEGGKNFVDVYGKKPKQNGIAVPLLCHRCDGVRFGGWEDSFIRQVVRPVLEGHRFVEFGSWLRPTVLSIAWRLMTVLERIPHEVDPTRALPAGLRASWESVREEWASVLLRDDRRPEAGVPFPPTWLFWVGTRHGPLAQDFRDDPRLNGSALLPPPVLHRGHWYVSFSVGPLVGVAGLSSGAHPGLPPPLKESGWLQESFLPPKLVQDVVRSELGRQVRALADRPESYFEKWATAVMPPACLRDAVIQRAKEIKPPLPTVK